MTTISIVKKIRSLDIDEYGEAVLFEDKTYKSFGVARIEKSLVFCIDSMEVHLVIG